VDDHYKLAEIRKQKDLEKDKRYKEDSRERLKQICLTKVRTTMIGAVEAVEKRFEQLYNKSNKPTNEQLLLEKIFGEIRTEILDKGNQQMRNLETEFEQYVIEWKRFTLQLPVRPLPR
jgi:hypothetical protein